MQPEKKVISYYKSAIVAIFENKIILVPFLTIAFLQLLLIEILYFYPKYPLNTFFGPLISKLWSPIYMHYPSNLFFMPKLFQIINGYLNVLVSSFLICTGIHIISTINHGKRISMREALKEVLPRYVHILVAALIIFFMIWGCLDLYKPILERALKIRSESGKFYILKMLVVHGATYFSIFVSIFVTALWGYVYQSIVIEKKNILKAIGQNFIILFRAPIFTFFTVFWTTTAGCSILILRSNALFSQNPELSTILFALGVLVVALADIITYTALTIYFLAWTEARKDQQ